MFGGFVTGDVWRFTAKPTAKNTEQNLLPRFEARNSDLSSGSTQGKKYRSWGW